jgi:uncharacterized membrane protein YgcG
MTGLLIVLLLLALVVVALVATSRRRSGGNLDDAKAEARRWVERLGGQVMNLTGTDEASRQAIADASERYTAAGSQMDQATTAAQCKLVTKTALEGLYYVRAARLAMGLDPGPDLPADPDARGAGKVGEDRQVSVEGHEYEASPNPGTRTPHYYPGGMVAGRPVPQGWYSEPWWKPALVAGAWGVGSFLVMDALFSGMDGIGDQQTYDAGYDAGFDQGMDGGGFDNGGFGGGGDQGGGFDFGGGDWGGGDLGGGNDNFF